VRATPHEKSRTRPGDELIGRPIGSFDHAITIRRPRDVVWPWLAQMGAGSRAGWYRYDFLDNGRQPSAKCIRPDRQHLAVGMIFPALPDVIDGFTLLAVETARVLVLGWKAPTGTCLMTWAFVLEDADDRSTRLIVRVRGGPEYRVHRLPWWASPFIVKLVHFIMQRKQLLGIARRAELDAATSTSGDQQEAPGIIAMRWLMRQPLTAAAEHRVRGAEPRVGEASVLSREPIRDDQQGWARCSSMNFFRSTTYRTR